MHLEYHLINNVCIKDNNKFKCATCSKTYKTTNWLNKHSKKCNNGGLSIKSITKPNVTPNTIPETNSETMPNSNQLYTTNTINSVNQVTPANVANSINLINMINTLYSMNQANIINKIDSTNDINNTTNKESSFGIPINTELNKELININNTIFNNNAILNNNLSNKELNNNQNKNTIVNDDITCNYCKKVFSKSSNLKRHVTLYCKIKKEKEEYAENEIKAYKDMLLMLKEQLNKQNKKMESLEQQLSQPNVNASITQNNTLNNTINNIQNNIQNNIHNTVQNNSIHVTINAYGNENLDYLKTNDYFRCFNKGIDSVLEYLKMKHFDPKHPENHNLYIPNIKQPYLKTYDGTKFIIQTIDKVIKDVIDNNLMELDDKYDELKSKLFNKAMQRYGIFISNYDGTQREDILKYLKEEVTMLLYNERTMPIGTQKQMLLCM